MVQTSLFDLPLTTKILNFSVPSLITKDLKLGRTPTGGKRIRLSSNFLDLMGFCSGTRTTIIPVRENSTSGIRIISDGSGKTKIYQRSYHHRRNNPLESVIDIQNQNLISSTIPSYTERLHISLREGEIIMKPLANETFSIRKRLLSTVNPFESFVAMTSGVDLHCLRKSGFSIRGVLEYRPQEARDKTDLTETGALNSLANASPKYVFNEDISTIDWDVVKETMKNDTPVGLLHLSLQCDDFSPSKSNSLKRESVENLSTTADLVYDGLRMVETIRPAVVMVENVGPFHSSAAGELLRVKLGKWGYHVSEAVLDARNFNGLTSRKRYYLVASVWPGFEMPLPNASPPRTDLWDIVMNNIEDCRDVTHTSTVHLGIETGRARILSKDKPYAPTVMKSQNRQAKDSIFIEHNGRYLMPNENLLRQLNSIPGDFNLESCSATIASEIIGQSIDYNMHEALTGAVYKHLRTNTLFPVINLKNNFK